ncbi:pimeloyl-ACP methyl ester carboxylesterase [Parvibaculum indicum]|uniref:alpha/beta fold hydrolase n=1 Tax=Parvibaculum indicum TaxID=562969 RepID=UPI00142260F8|nr:alpha/beta hydrolase [Parvibaculum indicum]NIJ42352.1 pimeloyl-ACP methyl ester carboxylesterase [Parvibaculum indicum]
MPHAEVHGLQLYYETHGDPRREAIILIMGLGGQLIDWPERLIDRLTGAGYRVIRFDNRDAGLSTKFDSFRLPDVAGLWGQMLSGRPSFTPYTLDDMAADTVGLMDALGLDKAHVAGVSLGGMIAQAVAAQYPARVLSLTAIMSTSGNPRLPPGKPDVLSALTNPVPASAIGDQAIVEHGVWLQRLLASPGYRQDDEALRAQVRAGVARGYDARAVMRQFMASVASGDRRAALRRIVAPTVVMHGEDDPLVPLAAGRDVAENIPGAEFRSIPGMGHDVPPALADIFAEAILSAAARAPRPAARQKPVSIIGEMEEAASRLRRWLGL